MSIPSASLAANYIAALDIFGWLGAGVEACIAGSGSLIFFDSASLAKTAEPVSAAYSRAGMTCAVLTRAGSLALVPGPAAQPAVGGAFAGGSSPGDMVQRALSNCQVTTGNIMRLRAAPGGAIIGHVLSDVTLSASARTAGWFKISVDGIEAWLSADYVTASGACG